MIRQLSVVALIVAVAAGGAGLWTNAYLNRPMTLAAEGHLLNVEKGRSLTAVAMELENLGILEYPRIFSTYGRVTGLAESIQAGEYELKPGTTPVGLLEQLVEGRVKLHSFTIVEGWTVAELLAALRADAAIVDTLGTDDPAHVADAVGLGDMHPEGQFFPDTYRFPLGTRDIDLLKRANFLMQERLNEAWDTRQAELVLSDPYDALILASIVEKETALESERAEIAGVFVRRLEKGMRLQTDPTVIYGLGDEFSGNLTRTHLETDTPYNTYTRGGLPPTPIALPGDGALRAAVNPAPGDSLYFVATGRPDGSHYFTTNLSDHNKAVAKYLQTLREGSE